MTTNAKNRARAAAVLLCAAGLAGVSACSGPSNADPTPSSTLPTYNPATQKAEAAKQKKADIANVKANYKKWIALQPNQRADLPPEAKKIATQYAIGEANETNRKLFAKGITTQGETRFVSMRVTSYERHPHWTIAMRICTASTLRFFKDGKDVTTDSRGNPIPKGKEVEADNVVTFKVHPDGHTWLVDTITPKGKSC